MTAEERKEYQRLHYLVNRDRIRQRHREWHLSNKAEVSERKKRTRKHNWPAKLAKQNEWRRANAERVRAAGRRQYAANREKIVARKVAQNRRKWETSVSYRIRCNLATRIGAALKRNTKAGRTIEMLGCSIADFRMYLESKFEQGMSCENYGSYWHLDHIIPCALFDLRKPEHQRRCFHFSNIQPMDAIANIRKGARIGTTQMPLI